MFNNAKRNVKGRQCLNVSTICHSTALEWARIERRSTWPTEKKANEKSKTMTRYRKQLNKANGCDGTRRGIGCVRCPSTATGHGHRVPPPGTERFPNGTGVAKDRRASVIRRRFSMCRDLLAFVFFLFFFLLAPRMFANGK